MGKRDGYIPSEISLQHPTYKVCTCERSELTGDGYIPSNISLHHSTYRVCQHASEARSHEKFHGIIFLKINCLWRIISPSVISWSFMYLPTWMAFIPWRNQVWVRVRNSWYLYMVMKRNSHYWLPLVYRHLCLNQVRCVELNIVIDNNALQGDAECPPWFLVAVIGDNTM